MSISDRLGAIRQLLSSGRSGEEDERLLQLYWNRAELKKELSRLQDERRRLLEQMRLLEGAAARSREQLEALEEHLGDPDAAANALVYFQLRALWRACAARLGRFAQQLQQQQQEREHRRQLIEFDQLRRRRLAEFDQRIADARSVADRLKARLEASQARLATMRGFWNYLRRRRLAEVLEAERAEWDAAATEVTDLSDDRADVEHMKPAPFVGVSIDGRRIVNTAVIAYAQQLTAALSAGGLAMLAKEATMKRVFDVRYGGREECARLMAALREAHALVQNTGDDLRGLKERTDALRAAAIYRDDTDTIPLTDSIGALPAPAAPVSGLETVNRAGVNVLVDDYWDVYQSLMP
ncbi:MAG TPA: hypothetical protein VK025_13595 [Steroidobacter sp.]|nr:hypothetical protein [Steroidobacter sp.]